MSPKRPVYLNLMKIQLPPAALVSIMHRVGGALLFLFIPFALSLLQTSLMDASGFARARHVVQMWPARVFLIGVIWFFWEHFFNGLRHLGLDLHYGLTRAAARRSSYIVLGLSLFMTLITAWWIW